jgi:hypothetical protein
MIDYEDSEVQEQESGLRSTISVGAAILLAAIICFFFVLVRM